MRRFQLHRDHDETGVSGTGIVAEGVLFSSGRVALEWASEFPTSVVFHDRGMESVEAVHGHNGKTRVVFLDAIDPDAPDPHYPDHVWVWVDGNYHDAVVIHREWAAYTRSAAERAEAETDAVLADQYAAGCADL